MFVFARPGYAHGRDVLNLRRSRARATAASAFAALVLVACSDAGKARLHPPRVRPSSPAAAAPTLDDFVEALDAVRGRIERPEDLAALRVRFGAPLPVTQHADALTEARVREAISRIAAATASDPALDALLGRALEHADGMGILSDTAPGARLRFDLFFDVIKVPPCALDWPEELFAVALTHELAHVGDHLELGERLGLGHEEQALLMDAAPEVALGANRVTMEERAFRAELMAARSLGVRIPLPSALPPEVEPRDPACRMTTRQLLGVLALLAAAPDDQAFRRLVAQAE